MTVDGTIVVLGMLSGEKGEGRREGGKKGGVVL